MKKWIPELVVEVLVATGLLLLPSSPDVRLVCITVYSCAWLAYMALLRGPLVTVPVSMAVSGCRVESSGSGSFITMATTPEGSPR